MTLGFKRMFGRFVWFEGQVIHWKWTKAGQAPMPAQLKEAA